MEDLEPIQWARFVRLLVWVKAQGEDGKIMAIPPAKMFCRILWVDDYLALVTCLKMMPGLTVLPVTTENVTSYLVKFKNWRKYQGDISRERVRKFRSKNKQNDSVTSNGLRGEEKRRDVTSTSSSTSPALRASPLDAAVATRETTETAGGQNARNEELRGTGILEQAAKRFRTLGLAPDGKTPLRPPGFRKT